MERQTVTIIMPKLEGETEDSIEVGQHFRRKDLRESLYVLAYGGRANQGPQLNLIGILDGCRPSVESMLTTVKDPHNVLADEWGHLTNYNSKNYYRVNLVVRKDTP